MVVQACHDYWYFCVGGGAGLPRLLAFVVVVVVQACQDHCNFRTPDVSNVQCWGFLPITELRSILPIFMGSKLLEQVLTLGAFWYASPTGNQTCNLDVLSIGFRLLVELVSVGSGISAW